MSGDRGAGGTIPDEVREIAAQQGLADADEASLERVALWLARRLRLVSEHTSDVVSIHDAEGRIEYVSPRAERVLGWKREELLGRHPWRIAHPDHRERLRDALRGLLEGKDVPDQTFRGVGPGGRDRWLEVSGRVVETEDGVRMVASTRDVTRRRQLEQVEARVRRLDAVGRVAGGVAHNLNNRLMAIKGEVTLLADGKDLSPEEREALERIDRSVERGARVVRDLLTFSRRRDPERRVVELTGLLEEWTPWLHSLVGDGVTVEVRRTDRPAPARIDPDGLRTVLRALMENAGDAMPGGGRLVVGLEVDGSGGGASPGEGVGLPDPPRAMIRVEDTGDGVSPAVLGRIFEPFSTGWPEPERRGLGLAVAYGIVEDLEGTIVAESTEGEGTRMTVVLPLASRD